MILVNSIYVVCLFEYSNHILRSFHKTFIFTPNKLSIYGYCFIRHEGWYWIGWWGFIRKGDECVFVCVFYVKDVVTEKS